MERNKPLIIAHRGANSLAPENTLKSFQMAIDLKADYVEFDIHESKDGVIVIMHDSSTLRTTGYPGLISNMTLEELKELNCGDGEKIPTLKELIEIAKGNINLQCEIKAEGLAEKLVDLLREEYLLESTIISSFNHEELLKVKKIEPKLTLGALEPTGVGWITDWFTKKKLIDSAIENGFNAIHPLYKLIDDQLINYAHENDLLVNAWTVDSKRAMSNLVEMGIDGIITNDIEKAKEVLKRD